jgi:hypothetical protein
MAMKHGLPFTPTGRWARLRMKLQLFFWILVPKRLRHTGRHVLYLNFSHSILCPFKQADFILAESQEEEAAVAGKERQERFDIESAANHNGFRKIERQVIGTYDGARMCPGCVVNLASASFTRFLSLIRFSSRLSGSGVVGRKMETATSASVSISISSSLLSKISIVCFSPTFNVVAGLLNL